jgi:hypothetical protein
VARKVKIPPSPSTRKGAKYKVGKPIDICGQDFQVWVDPKFPIEGECDHSTGTITLQPQAPARMAETLIHEALHAMIEACGLKWLLRERFKLSASAMAKLDEDMIRVLAPALHSTLRRAGWLRLPTLLQKSRHRRA